MVFAFPNVACTDPVYSGSRPVVMILLGLSVCVPIGFFVVVWRQRDALLMKSKQRLSTSQSRSRARVVVGQAGVSHTI